MDLIRTALEVSFDDIPDNRENIQQKPSSPVPFLSNLDSSALEGGAENLTQVSYSPFQGGEPP